MLHLVRFVLCLQVFYDFINMSEMEGKYQVCSVSHEQHCFSRVSLLSFSFLRLLENEILTFCERRNDEFVCIIIFFICNPGLYLVHPLLVKAREMQSKIFV